MSIIRGLLGGPKSERFGIGLAVAFGWDGRLLHDASGRPCWRRGGLVSLSKQGQKPRGLGLGLAAAFALSDAVSWLGIWIPCLKGPPSKRPQPKACFSRLLGETHSFPVVRAKAGRFGLGTGCRFRPWMLRPGWGSGSLQGASSQGLLSRRRGFKANGG